MCIKCVKVENTFSSRDHRIAISIAVSSLSQNSVSASGAFERIGKLSFTASAYVKPKGFLSIAVDKIFRVRNTVAQKCKTQKKQIKTKITFLYHFYTILIHFYPKHETQLTILSHNFLFCDMLENTKHIWNHKTHLQSQNTFRNHKTHLQSTKHIWNHKTIENHKTHLEITKHICKAQNTFRNHKTHLESQNTFRNHKTHLESQNTFKS